MAPIGGFKMKLEGKTHKEVLVIILDYLYNMITDGDELYDDEIIEILNYCKKNNLDTDFNCINDLGDYDDE